MPNWVESYFEIYETDVVFFVAVMHIFIYYTNVLK